MVAKRKELYRVVLNEKIKKKFVAMVWIYLMQVM